MVCVCVCVCVCIYTHNVILLLNNTKEWNLAICNSMEGTGGYYAKWNKSEKERDHMISLICGIWETWQKTIGEEKEK